MIAMALLTNKVPALAEYHQAQSPPEQSASQKLGAGSRTLLWRFISFAFLTNGAVLPRRRTRSMIALRRSPTACLFVVFLVFLRLDMRQLLHIQSK